MNIRNSKSSSNPKRRSYCEKYVASRSWREGSGEALFLSFLESLNVCDWQELICDLIQQKPESLDVFRPPPGDDLLAYAAIFLNRVGSATRSLIREAIGRLLSISSARTTINKPDQKLVPLLSFCRLLREPCESATLSNLVTDNRFSRQIRLMAAQILANQSQALPLDYWHKLDLEEAPELLSTVISALAAYSPKLALETLKKVNRAPSQRAQLEYPLRLVLRQLIRSGSSVDDISLTLRGMPRWAAREVRKVLQLAEFASIAGNLEPGPASEPDTPRTLIDSYLAGKVGLAEVKSEKDLDSFVEEALANWRPLKAGQVQRSMLLIQLVRQYPSPSSVRVVMAALEAILRESTNKGLSRSLSRLSKEILAMLAEHSLLLVQAGSGSTPQSREFVAHYQRLLRMALRFQGLAPIAFKQIVDYAQDRPVLVSATRAALREGHMTAKECDLVLRHFYSSELSADILQAILAEANVTAGEPVPEDLLEIGAKIYSLNPAFIFNSRSMLTTEDLIAMQDVAVPHTFAELASQFTSNQI